MNKLYEDGQIIAKQRFPSPHPEIHIYLITYLSKGLKVKGFLAEPQWSRSFPGILYLRGGINQVGQVRIGRLIQFASEGFIVMAPVYRGNFGGEGHEDFAGEDRYDAFYAFKVLEKHPNVFNKHIHLFGFSRGGVMALYTAIMAENICSVVTWGGVTNMFLTYEERVDLRRMMKRVIGGTPRKVPEHYEWRTPLNDVKKIKAPVLIIHGERDRNVSITHAYQLQQKLLDANKQVETWIFPQYTHYFPPDINRKLVHDLTNWMKDRQIKN